MSDTLVWCSTLTVEDVERQAYGHHIRAEDHHQVARLIVKAERRLLQRVRSIPARLDDGRLSVETLNDVIADMVLRVVRNPAGISSEQAGEYSYRLNWSAASGRIHITREDLANLGIGTDTAPATIWSKPPAWRIR